MNKTIMKTTEGKGLRLVAFKKVKIIKIKRT
jgi:hypothetical protein